MCLCTLNHVRGKINLLPNANPTGLSLSVTNFSIHCCVFLLWVNVVEYGLECHKFCSIWVTSAGKTKTVHASKLVASFGSFGDSITGPLQSIWDIFLYFFCRFVIHFGLWNHLIYWSKLGILLLSFFFCFGFSYFLISAMFLFASLENPCNAISTPSLQFRSIPIVAPAREMGWWSKRVQFPELFQVFIRILLVSQ